MAQININIDGKLLKAESGMTVLEAARANGIETIPTLCHDKRLEPFASCFLCVVKVEGRGNFIPSCATPVSDGMVITTDSPEIRESRKACLELLLSNHYADCVAPCKLKCPSSVDVQGYIALVAAGEYKEAIKLIKETNPFVATCGRVCTRPCEDECRRNKVDEKVGIDFLKRFASDKDEASGDSYSAIPGTPSGKKIAIVGAGPAGFSCAYYLAQMGHSPIVFDEKPNPGGMLRYGIPEYRLPKEILDKEVAKITELDVEVHYEKSLGKDFSIDDLKKMYDAVFIGIGCQANKPMGIEGESDTEGFLSGIAFLERCELERACGMRLEGKVLVVGGGNTAIDCARTSLRLGAESVTLVYRRSRKEMPANAVEVDAAEHEGVKFHFLAAPKKAIANENKRLKAVEFIKMQLGEPDASGRRRPVEVPGSEFIIDCDWAFAAVGQEMDKSCVLEEAECACPTIDKRWGTFVADTETGATNIEGVFAGGDDVTGAATVIEAIAAGKKSAYAIDTYFKGLGAKALPWEFISKKNTWGDLPDEEFAEFKKIEKQKIQELDPHERVKTFDETELGLKDKDAQIEASRCLECGCASVFTCDLKKYATEYGVKIERYLGEVGKKKMDDSHPFIRLDMNKCILCGRCVRICSDEVVGANVYGFVKRGFDTVVKPSLEMPLLETSCENCGMCISACPTGAIEAKSFTPKPGPWALEYVETTCGYCSTGCELKVGKIGESLVEIGIPEGSFACFRGRFGGGFVSDKDRIKFPKVKGKKAGFKTAFKEFANKLEKKDKSSIAVLVSPRLSNEAMFAANELAKTIGTKYIGSLSRINADGNAGIVRSTATYDDLSNAQTIFLIDGNIAHSHPAIGYRIVNAIYRGAKLFVMSSQEGKFTRLATEWLHTRRGSNAAILGAMTDAGISLGDAATISEISFESIKSALKALRESERAVIVYAAEGTLDSCIGDRALIGNLAKSVGAKVLLVRGDCNTEGLIATLNNSENLDGAFKNKKVSGIISIGEDPIGWNEALFAGVPVIAAFDILSTGTTKSAEIVFPLASFIESKGTYLSAEGKTKKVKPVFAPISGKDNIEIISSLCEVLGRKVEIPDEIVIAPPKGGDTYPVEKSWFALQAISEPAPFDSLDLYLEKLVKEKGLWK